MKKSFYLIGYASGVAGADPQAALGPVTIKNSPYFSTLTREVPAFEWLKMLEPQACGSKEESVAQICTELALTVSSLIRQNLSFCVIGGDHTAAIGTWSGVYDAVHDKGAFGLIWIDAHMDSHTPTTSESGNLHGMPLACLLGYGYSHLTNILHDKPKIKPQNVCLIGVRSYEAGEAAFLQAQGVKIYFMPEVRERGLEVVLQEAAAKVNQETIGFGVTLDMDALDPSEAPGVDVPEANGLFMAELMRGLKPIMADPRLLAAEIVEFDPTHDKARITEKNIIKLLTLIARQKSIE